MSRLRIYPDQAAPAADSTIDDSHGPPVLEQHDDGNAIATALAAINVRFERWPTRTDMTADVEPDTVLDAYATEINALKAAEGYRSADIVSMAQNHPQKAEMRNKFLAEHTHDEDEVRFFVDGAGLFTLHVDDRIYEILCQRGDLIGVPAGTRHWFDMGPNPHFVALRLFTSPDGWAAKFTGSDIADRFPRLDN